MGKRWFAIVVLAVLLAGCDSVESGTASPFPTTGRNARPAPPSPSAPRAADGTNVAACSDARCEVSVGPGTAIPLPASTGVRNVKVTAVTTDRVTFTGEDTGNSSSGWCTGQCDSNDIDGRFVVTLGPNSEDTQNGVAVTVEGFGDHRAVLTFDTAQG